MHQPFRGRMVPSAWALFVMIFLSGVGLIFSVVTLLYLSLNLISSKTNEIDEHRTALSVNGAIQTTVNKMSALVIDNAVWDDAARELYRPTLNESWLYSTWGTGFKVGNLYDGTFILDEHFHVLWGAFRGATASEKRLDFFGEGLGAIIRQHAGSLRDKQVVYSGLTRTREGVAFVAIGLVRPVNGPLQAGERTRRYLLLTRHVNPGLLRELGETFQASDLTFTAQKTSPASVPLQSAAGETLGYLHWRPMQPGAEAAKASSGNFIQIVITAVGLILLFILFSSVGLYRLARGEKRAREVARLDWLSRLPNRRALIERMAQSSQRAESEVISVVFVDLDGFKDVNDIYGHDTGDQLIVTLADAFRQHVPEGGMLARMGGDEFAMLQEGDAAHEKAVVWANKVLESLNAPVRLGERVIHLSASIGIASGSLQDCTSKELFRRADIAMYHAKLNGKGRVMHYDGELNRVREFQLRVENEIRSGLERDEFEVWYQPIVDACSGKMAGVEALMRWPRRPAGPLPPDTFIGIAETCGLIHALGEFVLRRACRDLQPLYDLKLSVNISPAQFRDPEFENKVARGLRENHFPAARLQLEVTETYVLENPERAAAAIANLKSFGTAIALDDFGTGYSSIGYLRRFNFDTIKIDKSLAGRVDSDPQAAALVSGTIRIATALGMAVTAEGVENAQQKRLLRQAGCDALQGYYFSQPMPIEALLRLRRERGDKPLAAGERLEALPEAGH
ncbi:putative bifunctional diguanylate cyclase/phosphodiesterase [Franconibacter daqui]|uniref:putative bifunctional diguanylate cyclase/phosphodiesterase n=1 Tax=Franconibacter daqui TaxID=2047724 RepID=UPI003BAF8AD2